MEKQTGVRYGRAMLFRALALALLLAGPAFAQPAILDVGAVPGLDAAGRQHYRQWLDANLPRAVAIGTNGRLGWDGGATTLVEARERALARCAQDGGTGCALYAENLAVIWPSLAAPAPPAPPDALISELSYDFTPDPRFIWWGPTARGVLVWAHGSGGGDGRELQPPPGVRPFNNAGFDVVRFDRYAMSDSTARAEGWLRDGLATLRRRGYRTVVVAGQSRGAWNALQMLEQPGLADAVIALSPAAQGTGDNSDLLAQLDDLRTLVADVPPSRARLAFVQFSGDAYASDEAEREQIIERLRPRLGALLTLDRPEGLAGHFAGTGADFGHRYGECLLHFALDPQPPRHC
jgi:pimeloyl-ACP methyl ester carboxylesterase